MPYKYNITNNATPPVADDYQWTGTNTLNQQSGDLSVPAGAITKLLVYAAGKDSAVNTRLILWTASGSALKQTATFSMSSGSTSVGGQSWREYSLSSAYVVASTTTYWIGLYRNPSGGHIAGTNNGTTGYRKTNTSSFPAVASMSGASSDSEELLIGIFYITKPDAPTGVTVSRVSDTRQTITWTRTNPTDADKPYTTQKIERWNNASGTWSELSGSLSSSATSYTDTSTVANRQYKYRVRAWNAAGNGSYSSESNLMYTTPAAPTSLTASRVGTTIVLNWTKNTTIANYQTVERNVKTDGDWLGWTALSSVVNQSAITYTDSSLEAYTEFQYRVKATVTTPALSSAYATSNTVLVLQAPDAPTNLTPNSLQTIDIATTIPCTWQHNPKDSSSQTYIRMRFREVGEDWSLFINKTTYTTNSLNVSTGSFTVGSWEWEMQTWGALTTGGDDGTGASPYSTTASFRLKDKPSCTIIEPEASGEYLSSVLTVEWEYNDSEDNQQDYLCKLYDENDVLLETKQGILSIADSETGEVTFDYTLANTTGYYVTLQVSNTSGLWSEEVRNDFTTLFLNPPAPELTAVYNNGLGIVTLSIINPSYEEGVTIETSYNKLYRSLDGIVYILAQDNIPINTIITDYLPSISGTTYYYVEAVSSVPTVEQSYVESVEVLETGYYILNSGNNYEDSQIFLKDTALQEKEELEQAWVKYAGRIYPVAYKGNAVDFIIGFSATIYYSEYVTLKELIRNNTDFFYRDWRGRYFKCSVQSPNLTRDGNIGYKFTCQVIRVDDPDRDY